MSRPVAESSVKVDSASAVSGAPGGAPIDANTAAESAAAAAAASSAAAAAAAHRSCEVFICSRDGGEGSGLSSLIAYQCTSMGFQADQVVQGVKLDCSESEEEGEELARSCKYFIVALTENLDRTGSCMAQIKAAEKKKLIVVIEDNGNHQWAGSNGTKVYGDSLGMNAHGATARDLSEPLKSAFKQRVTYQKGKAREFAKTLCAKLGKKYIED